jgi:hypothetical protein
MSEPILFTVPLLGALCVTAGLVTHGDVEHCFALQRTTYPGTPIGQILVLKGYLTQLELARMVAQQQNFRRMFCATLETSLAQAVNEPRATAVPDSAAPAAVPELATFTDAELDASPLFGAIGK